eukprot:XP_025003570.1 mitochondrial inner membrane protease ATP23 homolog isoform X2 [Gallus gallus]
MTSDTGSSPIATKSRRASWFAASSPSTTDPYAQLLIAAMKQSGWYVNYFILCSNIFIVGDQQSFSSSSQTLFVPFSTVFNDRHFSCENCDGCVSGGFDSATSQIVLCQNNIRHQSHMNRVVAHELIHAFDHCRAHVDWFKNVKHLACSEIRAANLSGDCTLMNEIARFKFGLKGHHQTCVRDRAIRSILAVRKVSRETAEKAVDEVFDACFNDLEPFGRIPHSKTDAKRAYKDFLNRDRYTANL